MKKIIQGNTIQLEVEGIHDEIKSVKADLSYFDKVRRMLFETREEIYERKFQEYSEELNKLSFERALRLLGASPAFPIGSLEDFKVTRRIEILRELVSLSRVLAIAKNKKTSNYFRQLEAKYLEYSQVSQPWQIISVSREEQALEVLRAQEKLEEKLRELRNRLRATYKKGKVKLNVIDLRFFFRSIIQFLFKNMDDEFDVLKMYNWSSSTFLIRSKNHLYGEGRYDKAVGVYPQKK